MITSRLSLVAFGLMMLPAAAMAQATQTAPQPTAAAPTANTPTASANADTGWSSPAEAAPVSSTAGTASPATAATPVPAPSATAAPAAAASLPPSEVLGTPPSEPPATASDEPPTLFGGKKTKLGGYGAVEVHYAHINGEDGVLTGGEGALLFDHRLAIGIAGYGWSNQQQLTPNQNLEQPYLHFGYGGLLLRYHVYLPNSPIYFSAAALVGGGAVGLTNTWNGSLYRENTDGFFIVEPELGVHVNFTRWMRLGVDAGYRVTSGISKFGFTDSNFNGVSLGGNVGFGWF